MSQTELARLCLSLVGAAASRSPRRKRLRQSSQGSQRVEQAVGPPWDIERASDDGRGYNRCMPDPTKTLTDLEGQDWGEPDYPSHLVVACHQMRHKPIGGLSDGEIRIAIGQQFSLPILVPLALKRLEQNPLLEADFFEGDLWKLVLMAKADFWKEHPGLWEQANQISQRAWAETETLDESWHQNIEPDLKEIYRVFLLRQPE